MSDVSLLAPAQQGLLAVGAVALVGAATVGLGAAALSALRLWTGWSRAERWVLAFSIGLGVLGWVVFPLGVAGWIGPIPLLALALVSVGGLVFFRAPAAEAPCRPAIDGWTRVLLAVLCVVLVLDGIEALAPPSDADSLAYHFALPRDFLQAGRIEFVARALDGAIPLSIQMTYLMALGLGGELGLTLWTGLCGAMLAPAAFVLARRFLPVNAALAVVVVLMTTPATVYGAGAGQIESKLALFAIAAALVLTDRRARDGLRGVVALGVIAGFYAGAKYTGLIFLATVGVAVVLHRRWFARGAVFSAVGVIVAAPWYVWNAVHTGDPLYPMLHVWLGWDNPPLWPAEQSAEFRSEDTASRAGVSRSLFWLVAYPFQATFAGLSQFESGRTGLGPVAVLLLPFAAAGLWRARGRLRGHPLVPLAVISGVFYVLWFYGGGSQKIRHLLPVYPLALICLMAAARLGAAGGLARPLYAGVAATVVLQLGGQALFTRNAAAYVFGDETRDAYLARTVQGGRAAAWMNANLPADSRVLYIDRQLAYLLDRRTFFAHPVYQRTVDARPGATDPATFWREVTAAGITHLALYASTTPPAGGPEYLAAALREKGCVAPVGRIVSERGASRTVSTLGRKTVTMTVFALQPDCPIAAPD